jgi:hypothetical protein
MPVYGSTMVLGTLDVTSFFVSSAKAGPAISDARSSELIRYFFLNCMGYFLRFVFSEMILCDLIKSIIRIKRKK